MKLTVKLMGGDPKLLELSESATVGELKQLISQHFKVPPYEQKLSCKNGHFVSLEDDSRTLSSYGLHSDSEVGLRIEKPEPFQVFVKNLEGLTKTYDVGVNETVDQLQTKIYQKERVVKDQQRLVFNGTQLEPGKMLKDYNITPKSTIHMTGRLRGG